MVSTGSHKPAVLLVPGPFEHQTTLLEAVQERASLGRKAATQCVREKGEQPAQHLGGRHIRCALRAKTKYRFTQREDEVASRPTDLLRVSLDEPADLVERVESARQIRQHLAVSSALFQMHVAFAGPHPRFLTDLQDTDDDLVEAGGVHSAELQQIAQRLAVALHDLGVEPEPSARMATFGASCRRAAMDATRAGTG